MGKYGYWVVLLVTLVFCAILQHLVKHSPEINNQVVNIAENSYFIGCAENLLTKGFDHDETIRFCKNNAKEYSAVIKSIMN